MLSRYSIFLVAVFALAGCGEVKDEAIHFDDNRNPLIKQAQAELENNNPEGAVSDYEQALGADPKLAKLHYQLGVIYSEKLNDPLDAIYHFRRFLALNPASDKAEAVKAQIEKQGAIYAASLPSAPLPPSDETVKLQSENEALKKQAASAQARILKLQGQVTQLAKKHRVADPNAVVATPPPAPAVAAAPLLAPAATPVGLGPAAPVSGGSPRALPVDPATAAQGSADAGEPAKPAVSVPAGPARSYKIVSGDSLWKISHKMYPGDTKNGIDRIKEANKEALPEGKPLKVGQVLVIP